VFWGDGHPDNVSEALQLNERQTNNRAEYTAVMKAIEQGLAKGIPRMIIRTDSKLLTQSLNEWFVIFY
jgi:ribonuclease HI